MHKRQEELYPLETVQLGDPKQTRMGFDPNDYLAQIKDFELSEAEKIEFLMILWDIMKRFVELGWALDSVSLLGEDGLLMPRKEDGHEVISTDNHNTDE